MNKSNLTSIDFTPTLILMGWVFGDVLRGMMNPLTPIVIPILFVVQIIVLVLKKLIK